MYDQLGDSTRSLHHFEQSVSSCEKEKRDSPLSYVLFNLASKYQDIGLFQKSLSLLERCRDLENRCLIHERSPFFYAVPRLIETVHDLVEHPSKALAFLLKKLDDYEGVIDEFAVAMLCS